MPDTPLDRILSSIESLPADARLRIETIADLFRSIVYQDESGEAELAMLWVMEELNDDSEACDEACQCGATHGTVQ
jgi:hypothetical protein